MINIEDFLKINITLGQILKVEKIEGSDKLLKLIVDFGFLPKEKNEKEDKNNNKEEAELNEVFISLVRNHKELEKSKETKENELKKDIRQIISGIAKYYSEPKDLVGKKCFFVTNLEHRKIKGYISEGMICAISDDNDNFSLLIPEKDLNVGLKVK